MFMHEDRPTPILPPPPWEKTASKPARPRARKSADLRTGRLIAQAATYGEVPVENVLRLAAYMGLDHADLPLDLEGVAILRLRVSSALMEGT